jgi:undecaprenyl diphosphate synthase
MAFFLKKWIGSHQKQILDHTSKLDMDKIPTHVAIIMDGNGRWAKHRGLPRVAGHHSGMKNIKRITTVAGEIGIKILTLYAFSTENWKRPKDEVEFLMKLPQEFLTLEIDELVKKNVKVTLTGWKEELPTDALKAFEEGIDLTKHNTGLILNIALNYGSRKEILFGVNKLIEDIQSHQVDKSDINEQLFSKYLLTNELADPDLLIRTSGELRISNFLLWQLAYSELFFTDKFWPDFSEIDFIHAIHEYQQRARRYGGI